MADAAAEEAKAAQEERVEKLEEGVAEPEPERTAEQEVQEANRRIIAKLSQDEIDNYTAAFNKIDKDGGGTVDAKELGLLMASLGQEKKEEDLKKMLNEVDADGSGEIDVEEFLVLMVNYVGPQGEAKDEEVEEAFRLMDADGGGTIDKSELSTCLEDLGEGMTDDQIAQCIAMVDKQGTGEISLPDFKAAFAQKPADGDEAKVTLMRKFRSSITTLIIKSRIGAAFASFDAQYNFLRFTDVTEICKEMEVWAAPETMKVGELSKEMAKKKIVCAPVANASGETYGFVDMMDLCAFMLAKVASSFRIQTTDPGALAMRLGKVSDEKAEWYNTAVKDIMNLSGRNPWRPIKKGYSFLDAAMQLGTGIPRVPLLDRDDKTLCLLSQSGLMGIINVDPKNRLGKMAAMTAEELGGKKDVVMINVDELAMEGFKLLEAKKVSAVAVVNNDGQLVGEMDSNSLKMIGIQFSMLASPIWQCYELSGQKMRQWNVTEAHTQRCDNAAELPACTCSLSTTMADMVNLVATGHHRRLWVVDDAKKPIGVISLTDLINAVIDRMGTVKVIGD